MACYIVFDGFHEDLQNNFISALLQLAPPLSSKKIINAQELLRENKVSQVEILGGNWHLRWEGGGGGGVGGGGRCRWDFKTPCIKNSECESQTKKMIRL